MDMEHDLRRSFLIHAEESLENIDHEFHGSEIIIEKENLEQRWPLKSRLRLLNNKIVDGFVCLSLAHVLAVNNCLLSRTITSLIVSRGYLSRRKSVWHNPELTELQNDICPFWKVPSHVTK